MNEATRNMYICMYGSTHKHTYASGLIVKYQVEEELVNAEREEQNSSDKVNPVLTNCFLNQHP